MRYTLALVASTAAAWPFMAPDLNSEKRAALLADTTGRVLGEAAVRSAREKRQGILGGGPLGGGLLGGILQPFSGILADLDLPTPQPQGLAPINGDLPGHAFVPPGEGDVRGLCPTLNTLANHNFLSHDGVITFAEGSNAVQTAYGFGYDLATFLSALGLIAGGDLVSGKYTIGGADARVPNTLGPALGLDKHGTFEIDGSISRQDNHFGNQADFIEQRWETVRQQAVDNGGGFFGIETWIANQEATYNTARATNPDFFAGVKYFAVSLAERSFVFRGLPNGTHEETPDSANIEPFFLNNTFPDDWFRRGTPFGLANLAVDLVNLYAGFPFELGMNDGTDSFAPLDIDISSMTPSQVMCLIISSVFDAVPGQIQPALADNIETYSAFVEGAISPFFAPFECSTLTTFTAPSAGCDECNDPALSAGNPDDPDLSGTQPPGEPLTGD
ncbi:hypothetical protein MMC10_010440 [Thelotrema lepadinum]|nr:hypothetical protein [Thelotrema lepadinum]